MSGARVEQIESSIPCQTIGGATLYLGDCLEVLPGLDEKADLLAVDAPYKLTSGGVGKPSKTQIPMRGKFDAATYANDGDIVLCDVKWADWMGLAFAALKADADAYFMANDKEVFPCWNAAMAVGFKHHNLLPWDKISPTANKFYMKNNEFVLYCWKGRARTINDPSQQQTIRMRAPRGADSRHKTQKPWRLMANYIRQSSQPGDLVLDPFMGSGSTGVAALKEGRRFIGIEKDAAIYETACRRLREIRGELDIGLFGVAV